MSLHDMYFSKQNKNYMYDILFKSILKETGYNIQNDEKYINIYRYHYASIFHRIDADNIIDLNREVLNSIGSLILKEIHQNSLQSVPIGFTANLTENASASKDNPKKSMHIQDTSQANIVLYSNQRLSNSLNRYNFSMNVNFKEFMPTTLTLIKDVKEQNSLFSNPNLNVLFNDTENIMFSLKDTKALNDKEYLTYEAILPDKIQCDKIMEIQIRNYLMQNPLETSDVYDIIRRKKITYDNGNYLCLELKDTSEFEIGSEIGLFTISSENIEIKIKETLYVKKVVGKYLLFQEKQLPKSVNALISLDHNVTLNGKI